MCSVNSSKKQRKKNNMIWSVEYDSLIKSRIRFSKIFRLVKQIQFDIYIVKKEQKEVGLFLN